MNVLVIGGGASGALAAIHLLHRMKEGRVVLMEATGSFAEGAAYGPQDPSFLLNVRAGGMSAFPQKPSDFSDWLGSHLPGLDEPPDDVFAPRRKYGEYLRQRLAEAASSSRASFQPLRGEAVALKRGASWTVATQSGTLLQADHIILAIGNRPPVVPQPVAHLYGLPGFEPYPWSGAALSQVKREDPILIVGTGLTMADIVCSLAARGHRGPIVAVSRRGLVPQCHGPSEPVPFTWDSEAPLLRQLVRWVRDNGDNWRGAIDGIRPHAPALWRSMSAPDKTAFMTRLRPFWDVHRHRLPPSSYATLSLAQEEGRLRILKGGVQESVHRSSFRSLVAGEWFESSWIFLATGPQASLAESPGRFLGGILDEGIVSLDPLGLGIEADDAGLCAGQERLWALGPLLKGSRWESTAVPEIRVQAQILAEAITGERATPIGNQPALA